MTWTVFYAWQSDLPQKYSRHFIHSAATQALSMISKEALLEEAPRLDQGREGVSGTPPLAATIYAKIENCDVFLADVSLVGRTDVAITKKDAKLLPNPNVMMELGYAAKSIGWQRIVLVMNTVIGGPGELPFDLRNHSFPLAYKLDDRERNEQKKREDLASGLASAIGLCKQFLNERIARTVARLDIESIRLIREFAPHGAFWTNETDGKGIRMSSPLDVSNPRLLDLGVVDCERIASENRYAYRFTKLGIECARYLGVAITERTVQFVPESAQVLVDFGPDGDPSKTMKDCGQYIVYCDRISTTKND